jgi:hypothetical protein
MDENVIEVSYGQTFDEKIKIVSLSDEIRFKMCMKLYKTHPTVEILEAALSSDSLSLIKNSI